METPSEVTVGHWEEDDVCHGMVKEFDIYSTAPNVDALMTELRGLANAHIAGHKKLLEMGRENAVLYYEPGERWNKAGNISVMTL